MKTVSEENRGDLMIDILSDLIVEDATKDPKINISSDETVEMRKRFNILDDIAEAWFELKGAEQGGEACQKYFGYFLLQLEWVAEVVGATAGQLVRSADCLQV